MDTITNHPRIAASGSIFDQLSMTAGTAEERSRLIREVVSLAMEGPLDLAPLPPMPVPGELARAAPLPSKFALTPLPTAASPFQICD